MSSARDRVLLIPELVEQIVINLRRASLSQLRLTCRAFHSAFSPHYGLAIRRLYHQKGNAPLDAVATCGLVVRSLVVDAINDQTDLYDALRHCQAIQRVDMRYWSHNDTLIYKVLDTQLWLRDLTLTLNGESANSILHDVLKAIIERAPPLERLKLDVRCPAKSLVLWQLVYELASACPSLQHLSFRGFQVFHDEGSAGKQLLHIHSLNLSDNHLAHTDIAFLLHAIPNLRTLNLSLHRTRENVFDIIDMNSGGSPLKYRMPHLTTLTISALKQHLSGLWRFIAICCPRIRNLDLRNQCRYAQHSDMLVLLSHFKRSGISLERLAVDYEPESCIEDWIRRLLKDCSPGLRELRLGAGLRFLSETPDLWVEKHQFWFPFAATLTTLHLESKYSFRSFPSLPHHIVNEMLRSMPLLVDLSIMDPMDDFTFLHGLGRCVMPKTGMAERLVGYMSSLMGSRGRIHDQDWSMERPFLQSLKLRLADNVDFDASKWNVQVVDRFRFLECFSIKATLPFCQLQLVNRWQDTLRPGLEFSLLGDVVQPS